MLNSLSNASALIEHVMSVLNETDRIERIHLKGVTDAPHASTVLFLIGPSCRGDRSTSEPCLILNKRSTRVKQPGDLCCPGGSLSTRLDSYLAKLLHLPGSPLKRWPYWSLWRTRRPDGSAELAVIFAASLRESFEEMRLNPLGVKLLGLLPPQQLVMFDRVIYPLVCWIPRQRRFRPNREVAKIVYIPLKNLLDAENYSRCRLQFNDRTRKNGQNQDVGEFSCFIHQDRDATENLWGATFRITMAFLDIVFEFSPPEMGALPIKNGTLEDNYLTGNG